MRYAILSGNVVTNIIEATPATVAQSFPGAVLLSGAAGIGSTWNGATFTAPPVVAIRVLARIDFLRRFTVAERTAIQASTDAGVKDFLFMLDKVSDVELDNSDTQNGVNYLGSLGLVAAGRAAQILA